MKGQKWIAAVLLGLSVVAGSNGITGIQVNAQEAAAETAEQVNEADIQEIDLNDASVFPDEALREHLKEPTYDKNGDGKLSAEEIAEITSFEGDCNEHKITDYTGIEHLTAMTSFSASETEITKLDLSECTSLQSIKITDNKKLESINVSGCIKLKELWCSNNNLTTLDLTNNKKLSVLNCENNRLAELNVSNNTGLTELMCSNNQLTSLDISKNKSLGVLRCSDNKLTELDTHTNIQLSILYCSNNEISKLDTQNSYALDCLVCNNNRLTTINVANNVGLRELWCENNNLSSLDLKYNYSLSYLNCSYNNLTSLNVKSDIEHLECAGNNFTSLDLAGCTSLKHLDVSKNILDNLDLSENIKLISLNCEENRLTALDISYNPKLCEMLCSKNQITKLDLSNNTELTTLNVSDNYLTSLDLSNINATSWGEGKGMLENQVYRTKPQQQNSGKYLIQIKKEGNSDFDSSKVSDISDANAILTEDGFEFADEASIPFCFTYKYETNLAGGSSLMPVTVVNASYTGELNITYDNTSFYNTENENPSTYKLGSGGIGLVPVTKEGAAFEKWVLWDKKYQEIKAQDFTELTDELIYKNVTTPDIELRAVFEPDVLEMVYWNVDESGEASDMSKDASVYNENVLHTPLYDGENSSSLELKAPVREGYTFEGWYTEPTFENKIESVSTQYRGYDHRQDVYAKWSLSSSDSKDDNTSGKNDDTTGKDDGTTGKDDGTSGKDDGTSGKNDGTTGKDDSTTGKDDSTTGKNDGTSTKDNTVTNNGSDSSENSKEQESTVKTGSVITDTKSKAKYTVTSTDKKTVEYKVPTKKSAKVTIPATVKIDGTSYQVTSIAKNAFKNNKTVTAVVIGTNVSKISDSAFEGCRKLTTVAIGKNVKVIGKKAFYNCGKLKTIKIQSTKLTKKTVGSNAFKKVSGKAKVTVPKKVKNQYKSWLYAKGLDKKVTIK